MGNKIYLSFVQRLMEKERLLLYAGYIQYEHWGINMVEAKHPPLI
jgi:hypothetical protein